MGRFTLTVTEQTDNAIWIDVVAKPDQAEDQG
jgi:hypothetical protein